MRSPARRWKSRRSLSDRGGCVQGSSHCTHESPAAPSKAALGQSPQHGRPGAMRSTCMHMQMRSLVADSSGVADSSRRTLICTAATTTPSETGTAHTSNPAQHAAACARAEGDGGPPDGDSGCTSADAPSTRGFGMRRIGSGTTPASDPPCPRSPAGSTRSSTSGAAVALCENSGRGGRAAELPIPQSPPDNPYTVCGPCCVCYGSAPCDPVAASAHLCAHVVAKNAAWDWSTGLCCDSRDAASDKLTCHGPVPSTDQCTGWGPDANWPRAPRWRRLSDFHAYALSIGQVA